MKASERKSMLWPIYVKHFEEFVKTLGLRPGQRKPQSAANWKAWNSAMKSCGDDAALVLDWILGHQWDNWKDRIHFNNLHHILKHSNQDRFVMWQRDPTKRPRQTSIYGTAKQDKGLPHTNKSAMVGTFRRKGQPGTEKYHEIEKCVGVDEEGNLLWEKL